MSRKKKEDVREEMLLISIGDLATFGYRYEYVETLHKEGIAMREKGMLYYDKGQKVWEVLCDRYCCGALMLRTTVQESEFEDMNEFIYQMMQEDCREKLFGAVFMKRTLFGILCMLVTVIATVFLCISFVSLILRIDILKNIMVYLVCGGAIRLIYYNRHGIYPPS